VRSEAWFQLSICEILSVFWLGIFFPFRFEKMNRSFRAQDSQMQAAVVKQRQQLRATMMKEKEEELALFLEMKKREKEQNNLLLINNTEEFDAPLGNNVFFFF
jgi:flagellar biosynthesis protein FliP